jgi:hypothetical protein
MGSFLLDMARDWRAPLTREGLSGLTIALFFRAFMVMLPEETGKE